MKNSIFLTSKLNLYSRNKEGKKVAHPFENFNGIIDNFKKSIKRYKKFVYIANTEDNYELNDEYANVTFKSFEMTLPFENYYKLDGRTMNKAKELIINADFIFISGGNIETQNNFFEKMNLKNLIKKTKAVICCVSAGSINSADKVYCPPENEIEYKNERFKKEYVGLGIIKFNILPHYNVLKDVNICEKKYIEDIIFPDSYDKEIYALTDGSYIEIKKDVITYNGIIYLIKDGKIELIK